MILGLEPLGLSPLGLPYDPSGDLSVSNPLEGALFDASLRRSFLVYAQPLNTITGNRETVKLGDGFASQSDDTLPDLVSTPLPHALFKAGLVSPYSSTNRVMSGGQIVDNALPSQGEMVFELNSGRLLPLKSLEWDLSPVSVLLGRPEYRLSQFAPIFQGVTGSINTSNPSECHVPLLDKTYRLKTPIITETYRGSGAALRGNGTTTFASGTCPFPSGSMTLECWIRPKTSSAVQKDLVGWRNGSSAGQRQIRFSSIAGPNNAPEVVIRNDAGTQFILSSSSTGLNVLVPASMYHLAFILDAANLSLSLVVDLDNLSQSVYVMPVTGTFATTLNTLAFLRTPDIASNFADVDIDEVRVYPSALTIDQINANRDRQLSSASSMSAYYKIDEGTGSTLFDSSPGAHNLTISGAVKWVGSLEGSTDLAGQTPPLCEGVSRQLEPVSVDAQNYVYEVSRNPTTSTIVVSSVADKGDPTYVIDAPVSDIYDWVPIVGHCVTSRMGTRTLLRLQAPPQGTLTVSVTSDVVDFAGLILRLAQDYPVVGNRFDNTEIDLIAFTQASNNYPQIVRLCLRGENPNIWDAIQDLAKKSGAWVTVRRTGELTVKVLEEPTTAKFRLNENDVQSGGVSLIAKTLAVKRVTLKYRPYQTTQQAGNLSTSLSQATIADLGKPYRSVSTPVSRGVLRARPSAEDLVQDTLYDDPEEVYNEALRRQVLWGVNRATYALPLSRGLYQYSIGDVIEVSILGVDGNYVENLQNALLVIVGYQEDPSSNAVTLEAWGRYYTYGNLISDIGEVFVTDDGQKIVID